MHPSLLDVALARLLGVDAAPVALLPARACRAAELTYDKVFRVLIVQFLDPYNFDVRSVKKSCIHIVHPDGRIIPFDTYNLFYRDTAMAKLPAMSRVVQIRA